MSDTRRLLIGNLSVGLRLKVHKLLSQKDDGCTSIKYSMGEQCWECRVNKFGQLYQHVNKDLIL